ncbi:MAG: transglutaminase-like domain-containing protein [Leptospiraceae bacterium]|nr:transglutaminase-like domain-containing protein [Leptospiraceae bacterium]
MKSFGNSFEEKNYSSKNLEPFFYELEFSNSKEKAIQEIAKRLPFHISLLPIIDDLKDSSLRLTVRNYFRDIQLAMIEENLILLAKSPKSTNYLELEKYVFLLSLVGDEFAVYKSFVSELDRISIRLGELLELNRPILTDEMKVHLLSRVIYEEEGFNGNQYFYHNPENSYLTKVLATKSGIPISLSVLYILIARRQNLPVYGVNFPLHFMISYESNDYFTFMDPFNAGVLVDKETCQKFLHANGYPESSEYFYRTSTLSILKRMYNNLLSLYKKNGEKEMELLLQKHLGLLEGK